MTNLVIVESPAKAKTIQKYLGKDFTVLASFGHVRDLIPKKGAVDPEHQFAMKYEAIEKNAKHLEAIRAAVKKADALYLAPDPDREGEAIAWHIHESLSKELKNKPVHRIVFHEITKTAIQEAVQHPREIAMDLVDAYKARRALDYLVGFTLSPLLWKKVRRGLSAGRVQSPALRLICERENEIEAFISQEYWSLQALCHKTSDFSAKLIELEGVKLEQFSIVDAQTAAAAKAGIEERAAGILTVDEVVKKQRKRQPSPPFITSTLQQEGIRKLGWSASKVMQVAQKLYEGGFITYMRTDSVNLAAEAIADIRDYIGKYHLTALPPEARVFKSKSKNAQEAHEAIRPTQAHQTPEVLKNELTPEQVKLYSLIWKRTISCQMMAATIDTVRVDLVTKGGKDIFRANGSVIVDPGFLKVYEESVEDASEEEGEGLLPELAKGDQVQLRDLLTHQHFTEPPPRYSEASLVKTLEEYGIGRPSTYASIISTLQNREYVILDKKRFHPTDVGRIVNKFLTQYFMQYVDYDFTAHLEDELDDISRGEKQWVPVMAAFWGPFEKQVEHIGESVQRKDVTHEELNEKCPKCEGKLSIRLGRNGRFIGCENYPECTYTRSLEGEPGESDAPTVVEGRLCPLCQSELHIKRGRYGKFIGCSQYPTCKHIEPLEKPKDMGVDCPVCKKGRILARKSRYGKLFYSCSEYPSCKYAMWYPPLPEPCPKCHWPLMMLKVTKRWGTQKACPQKECGHVEAVEESGS